MSTTHPTPSAPASSELTERYVHAATRTLPEDQRADVAEELRATVADRVESLVESGTPPAEAERVALVELGDPDRLAAGYRGTPLQLVGPELFPAYARVLKAVLLTVVPISTIAVAAAQGLTGASFGGVVGNAAWLAFTVAVQICFWVTLAFALVERGSAPDQLRPEEWTPEQLPALPRASRQTLAETVTNLVWIGVVAGALVWQQVASPIHDGGERVPVLDPSLWDFWLPLVFVLLAAEAVLEVVKYHLGGWSTRLAAINVVTGALFAAPFVYLAATERLLNPDVVRTTQQEWSAFDPGVVHLLVLVVAVAVWAWDSVDGFLKARRATA